MMKKKPSLKRMSVYSQQVICIAKSSN